MSQYQKDEVAGYERAKENITDFIDNTRNWQEYKIQSNQAESNLNNTRSDLSNYATDYGRYLESIAPEPEYEIVSQTSNSYYIYPSYKQYARSNEKSFTDNFASDLNFAQLFCKTDTVFPYNCNQYHSNLAQNYTESYSPYIGAYNRYRDIHKQLVNPKTDISINLLNESQLLEYQQLVDEYNNTIKIKAVALGLSESEYQAKLWKSTTATAYADLYSRALEDRGANNDDFGSIVRAVAHLGADIFYLDDGKDCGKILSDLATGASGCGMSALNLIPLLKLGKVAKLAKISKALDGVTDVAKAEEIIKGLDLGKDTEKILEALRQSGDVGEFLGDTGKVVSGAKPAPNGFTMTNGLADDVAKELGYVRVNGIKSASNAPIYKNTGKVNGPKFISPDTTSHITDFGWKGADKAELLTSSSKTYRSGTYSTDLQKIGN